MCPFCGTTSPAKLDADTGKIVEHDLVAALRGLGDDARGWKIEKRYVKWLLARHTGNVSAAAREARMDRKHLHDMAKKHGLRGENSEDTD